MLLTVAASVQTAPEVTAEDLASATAGQDAATTAMQDEIPEYTFEDVIVTATRVVRNGAKIS